VAITRAERAMSIARLQSSKIQPDTTHLHGSRDDPYITGVKPAVLGRCNKPLAPSSGQIRFKQLLAYISQGVRRSLTRLP